MSKAFNSSVRPRTFQKGELVLVLRRLIISHHKISGKFTANWKCPYIIENVYKGGAYHLIDKNSQWLMPPINGRYLKEISQLTMDKHINT